MLLQYQLRTLTWTINSHTPVQECLHVTLCIWFYFNMKTSHCCNRSYELCIRLQQEHNSCSIDSSDRTLSPIWGGMACWRDWNEHLTTSRLTWVHHISTSTVFCMTHRFTFTHAGIKWIVLIISQWIIQCNRIKTISHTIIRWWFCSFNL